MGIVDFTKQGSIGTGRLPKRFDLDIYRGDTLDELMEFRDAANVLINFTGFTALVEFKQLTTEAVVATPVTTVNYGTNGRIRMYIADTSVIPAGEYRWDIQLTDALGNRRTFLGGLVTVAGDVSD